MSACPVCFPWTLPFGMLQQRTTEGAIVALRFEQWLLYHLHVGIHQKDRWPGELEPVVDQTLSHIV